METAPDPVLPLFRPKPAFVLHSLTLSWLHFVKYPPWYPVTDSVLALFGPITDPVLAPFHPILAVAPDPALASFRPIPGLELSP